MISTNLRPFFLLLATGVFLLSSAGFSEDAARGWLNWRGPAQNGTSTETGLPDKVAVGGEGQLGAGGLAGRGGEGQLWAIDLPGRGCPVIADNKLFATGYVGDDADMQEVMVCLNAETGKEHWRHSESDFLSDTIYFRYAISSPLVDRHTGNIYVMTTNGLASAIAPDGKLLWQHSMMESFGRLTFPNGRTGSAIIDDDLVIFRGITSFWGKQGPARDRFYAFDKITGEPVWSSTPGIGPKDSSFSTPVIATRNNQRVFYVGTGCGNVVCVNIRTGKPLWRFRLGTGGVNASVVLYGEDKLIAIHGKHNLDDSTTGRMVCLDLKKADLAVVAAGGKQAVLDKSAEVWRNHLGIFTSSPVIVGNRIYQTVHTGELACVDAETGSILWHKKLAPDQLHASPLYADGKLYIPMRNGLFYIVKPSDKDGEILCKVQLEGIALGSPAAWNGKVYVHTTKKLYAFGKKGPGKNLPKYPKQANLPVTPQPPRPYSIQAIPNELFLRPGQSQSFRLRTVDAYGYPIGDSKIKDAKWEKFIPPTAKVKVKLNSSVTDDGKLTAGKENSPSAGMYKVTADGNTGIVRGRVLQNLPITEDFESFKIAVPHKNEEGVKFAWPPLPWIGARFKWEIRELDGNKVLVKTLDRVLFQRATTFIGHADMKNYVMAADVMTGKYKRSKGAVGLVNQRYYIVLVGNSRILEVSSNHERIKVSVPFPVKANTWYRLKTQVDMNDDDSGVVRAKAWIKGQPEPEKWTIEVPHKKAHKQGAPGLFGLGTQSKVRVYVDNISVTAK